MASVTITNKDVTALGLWDRNSVYHVARGMGGTMTLDPSPDSIQIIALYTKIGVIDAAATPAPANTAEPTISGTAEVGQTLTLDPGVWEGEETLSFVWEIGGVVVAGQTGLTFVVPADTEGQWVTAEVTAVGPGGTTTVETEQFGPVAE